MEYEKFIGTCNLSVHRVLVYQDLTIFSLLCMFTILFQAKPTKNILQISKQILNIEILWILMYRPSQMSQILRLKVLIRPFTNF